ncbi:MAG: hypothetical protein JRM91_01600 [Nitrososphaerota archaeon]|nr:hypothetical protein [Nitrososphaerota archaeon]MDG6945351.1 hypothetical protein [Nitrososphaerota archaeon]
MVDSKKLITATLFGVVIGVVYGALPFEIGDSLIIFEAVLLSLSFILLGPGGATYTGFVNGLVETPLQLSFGPFVFVVAFLYGVLVDLFCSVFKVTSGGKVHPKRLVASLTLSTVIVGAAATYAFLAFGFGTSAPFLELYLPILIIGVVSGTVGGFLGARLWERNLRHRFTPVQQPAN